MKKLIICITFLFSFLAMGQNRYVSSAAAGAGDGTSISSPWTLAQAAANATCGMTVFVRAGDYGSSSIVFNQDCNGNNPLNIVGVDSDWETIVLPTDAHGYDGSTINTATFSGTDDITDGSIPFLDSGLTLGNNGSGNGIRITGDNVNLSNFAVRGFAKGFLIQGNYGEYDNLNADFNGLHSSDNSNGFSPSNCCAGYNIDIQGGFTNLTNSFARDGSHVGISFGGAGAHYSENVEVYTSNLVGGNSTDYQFFIQSNSNRLFWTTVRREPGTLHRSHGIVFKPNGRDARSNLVENFYLENVKLEIQFGRTFNNVVRNGLIEDNSPDGSGNIYDATLIQFANGAHDNLVENVTLFRPTACIKCADWDDGASSNPADDGTNGGVNNTVNNILCIRPREAGFWHDNGGIATGFRAFNVTIDRGVAETNSALFRMEGTSTNWELDVYNSNFIGFTNFLEQSGTSFNITSNSVFNTINLDGGSLTPSTFSGYAENDVFENSPSYDDTANYDYTPSDTSLEFGNDFSGLLATQLFDINETERTGAITVGAFEYSGAMGATCDDGIQNGDETGIDCGGSCEPCTGTTQFNRVLTRRFISNE